MTHMMQNVCSVAGTRDQRIVAYLYEEGPFDERVAFERHLTSCALCRAEVDALRGVRTELGHWASPAADFSVVLPERASLGGTPPVTVSRWQMPVWAQAAAALLLVGVGAGAANLEIDYSSAQGLSVRTGWRHAETSGSSAVAALTAPQPSPLASQPWRTDLAALEDRLRGEMSAHQVAAALSPSTSEEAALRRVRTLLGDSERRQQREIALRFAEMAREVESQRQSDLVRIDRNLGLIQSRTGMEVMRTQQQVNSLAQRVSQRQ